MPVAAPKPCRHPGCGRLVSDGSGYCPSHKKPGWDTKKTTAHQRGYGYAWQKLRLVVLKRDSGLCQPCLEKGKITVANTVDHKTPKAEGGNDDLENLQTICKRCHTMKTAMESARGGEKVSFLPEWLPAPAIPVTIVCGPPGSGKTTYASEHAGPRDLVVDVDSIAAEMFNLPMYRASTEQIRAAIRYRNKLLASLAEKDCGYQKAWLIVTAGSPDKRQFWQRKYGDNMVIMITDKETCVERVKADGRRSPSGLSLVVQLIRDWR